MKDADNKSSNVNALNEYDVLPSTDNNESKNFVDSDINELTEYFRKETDKEFSPTKQSEENTKRNHDKQDKLAIIYNIGSVGGNFIGDKTRINGDVSSHILRDGSLKYSDSNFSIPIPEDKIRKISSVYTKPSQYSSGENIITQDRILFLFGGVSIGKYTSSIHLLLNFTTKIYSLSPITDLGDFKFSENTGYIYECVDKEKLNQLSSGNQFLVSSICQSLKEKSSYLIITFSGQVQQGISEIRHLAVQWSDDVPSQQEILEKHLDYNLAGKEELIIRSKQLIQEQCIQNLLQQRLKLSNINELAIKMLNILSGELTPEEVIEKLSFSIDRKVEQWFNDHQDINQRLLMITIAVFNGCEHRIIQEQTGKLKSLFEELAGEKSLNKVNLDQLGTKLSDSLKTVYAHIDKTGIKNTHYGNIAIDRVVFDEEEFQSSVLAHVWQVYREYTPTLKKWLRESGFNKSVDVRSSTAKAVSTLSKYSFGEIEEDIIRPWLNHESVDSQWLAGITISCLSGNDLDLTAKKLVHSWSKSSSGKLRYASIAAYSGELGSMYPDSALDDLLAIARKDLTLIDEITFSIINIFNSGELLSVLNTLKTWALKNNRKEKIDSYLGIFAFSKLISSRLSLYDMQHNNPPTLLWLSNKNEIYKDLTTNLLEKSLESTVFQKYIFEGILSWFKSLDNNPESELFDTMGSIVYNLCVCGGKRTEGRFFRKFNSWIITKQSQSAEKIFLIIKENI
jgi:hypothetical protein